MDVVLPTVLADADSISFYFVSVCRSVPIFIHFHANCVIYSV